MTPTPEPSTVEPNANPRPGQFSLRRLLLAIVAISALLAFVDLTQRFHAAQTQLRKQAEEIAQLHAEAGHFIVGNRSTVHVLGLPTQNDDSWKWKIYLPSHSFFQLRTAVGQIPRTGFANLPSSSSLRLVPGTEFTLEVFLQRDAAGQATLSIRMSGNRPTETTSYAVPAEIADELLSGKQLTTRQLGMPSTWTMGPGGHPVELLRVRRGSKLVYEDPTTKRFETVADPSAGVLLWLESKP